MLLPAFVALLVAVNTVAAVPQAKFHARDGNLKDLFDYVVVGGGTSGLAVAARLSEDPKVTVAIIEAGDSVFDNPAVTNASAFGQALGTAIDWGYQSVPQKYTNDRVLAYSQGKALGGSSAINGMTYIRAEDVQIDAWEKVGAGLNWKTLVPYFKKSENFTIPTPSQAEAGATYDKNTHGYKGPVNVGWTSSVEGEESVNLLNKTWTNLKVPFNRDFNDGKMRGFGAAPSTLDAKTDIRDDSARAYYWPVVAQRKNLYTFVNTTANRIEWDRNASGKGVRAIGVEVTTATGAVKSIRVRREVISSLGSLRTPTFLEYSGVGNPKILSKFGIPVKVNLPTVGENLQDQLSNFLNASLSNEWNINPALFTFATASDLFGSSLPSLRSRVEKSLRSYAKTIAGQSSGSTTAAIQERLLRIQFELSFDKELPLAEILQIRLPSYYVVLLWSLNPFARGSVHISSKNVTAYPAINPNFFMFDWDLIQQAAAIKITRRTLATPPLADYVGEEYAPGLGNIPGDASEEEWAKFLKESYLANNHPIGTAAMMARELGGVIDSRHKVYGTQNVRVMDASVLPFQICGHPTALLYALAERAADIIKEDGRKYY